MTRSTRLAPLGVGLVALAAAAAGGLTVGVPAPAVHDEHAYLLGADTFLEGRLTNPPHPMGPHLETFHVIQRPTYAMKYPPGPSLFLAAGQAVGHPIYGVWLSAALMAAAVTWALQGVLPTRWAVLGGLLVVLRLGVFSYWAQSYWGGASGALAGALLLGGLLRWVDMGGAASSDHTSPATAQPAEEAEERPPPGPGVSVAMGVGALLLANVRPFEGFVMALPCAALLGWSWARGRLRGPTRSLVVPGAAVLLAGCAAMGVYDHRVTGSALRLPYAVHTEQYTTAPLFVWGEPRDITYRHPRMARHHRGYELASYRAGAASTREFLATHLAFVVSYAAFLVGALLPALGLLGRVARDPRVRFCLAVTGVVLGATFVSVNGGLEHYVAPLVAAVLVVAMLALRSGCREEAAPRRIRLIPLLVPAILGLAVVEAQLHRQRHLEERPPDDPSWQRARLLRGLAADGRRHLVLVEYGEEYTTHDEWVYNRPDVDCAVVVWARSLSPARDAGLLGYYPDRVVWRLRLAPGLQRLDLVRRPVTGPGDAGR